MTAPLKPPTSVRGWVSEDIYGAILDDLIYDLPSDLIWPLSVRTYATMSREARLAAIVAGWTLQLRRAQWQLDGRGCRPDVVKLVADDMGLLQVGDDDPGPARLEGVSWNEHLRAVLLSATYGAFGFALHADTSSGLARLIGLYERAPWTINEIHVDPKSGAFLGVTQDGIRSDKAPQIKAADMAWYCRERVGSNWAGTSLLRNSFAPWLIKREMMRVHATASRRWGMGVPVMEALPGTNPSPTQMQEAQQLAAAARAGDHAGAATPPGFSLRIAGLSGSVPDTLDFIRFLNQEMASSALMPHLDLGTTATGSRALAGEFIDNFMLALETEAEAIADVATRQVAARIVRWNWDNEPVPRVVVSGIGSRREVTAESLQLLLSSGALAADPGLEAWVRREFRLPERQGMPTVAPTTPTVAAASVRQRAPRLRRRETPGQLALPVAAAAQSGPDLAAIQEVWEQAKADLLEAWPDAAQPMVDDLAAQVEAAVEAGDLGALGTLVVSAAVVAGLASLIGDAGVATAAQSAAGVVAEAAAQNVTIEAPDEPGADRTRQTADAIAGVIAAGYASGAGRTALQHAGPGASAADVAAAVRVHLDDLGTSESGLVGENVGAALSVAQNAGRVAALEAGPPARYRSVESNDRNVCQPCKDMDGTTFNSLAEALVAYPASGLAACEGRMRCRGLIAPIWD